jgi:putative transposase
LDDPDCPREKVRARAESVGRHPAPLDRWLHDYRHGGRHSPLVPAKRGIRRGHALLDPEVETILTATLDELYLSGQKRAVQHTYNAVARRCHNAGIKRPHPNTVRNRIKALSDKETLRRREGGKAVQDK